MNLYDQLLQLQLLPNAFAEWATYRSQLTHFILKHTTKHEHIALIGAGRCNDLDLSVLARHFHSITLLDKDDIAMKEALKRYNLEDASHITTQVVDFVGISPKVYRHYADTLILEVRKRGIQTDCQHLAKFARDFIQHMTEEFTSNPLDLGTFCYDTIIAVGVHSQLLSMLEWIWSIILQTIGQEETSVRNEIISMNTFYVTRLNDALLKASKDKLIIGCEKQRVGRVGSIQGAIQCLLDIQLRTQKGQLTLLDSMTTQWPFNISQNIIYKMELSTFDKSMP